MIHWVDLVLLLCAIVAVRWAYMVGKEAGFYAGLERGYKDREEDLEFVSGPARAELAELRKELLKVDASETKLITERDELQEELQNIEIALGGDPNFADGSGAMRLAQEAAGEIESARKALAKLRAEKGEETK